MKKIALYGGSFNPIHEQHLEIVKILSNSNVVDEIWIVPCKKHAFNKNFAPAKHRVNMIKLALKEIKNAKLCYIELKTQGTNYTINTIKRLKTKYNHKFYWIIGTDILHEITEWKGYKKLLKEIEFIIFKRQGYSNKKIKGLKIYAKFKHKEKNISSTNIRKRIKLGKPLKKLLPLLVKEYIIKNKLYLE